MEKNSIHVWTVWHPEPTEKTVNQTFAVHKDILDRHREVFWGVISKRKYEGGHPFEEVFRKFQKRIKDGQEVFLFIKSRDEMRKSMVGTVKEIMTDFPSWQDSEKVPDYYKIILKDNSKYEINYWFLLSHLKEIESLKSIQISHLNKFNSKLHGSSGYPYPDECKVKFDSKKQPRKKGTV